MFRSPASRIFFALFICLGTWQWQYHVFIPSNTARAVANQRPIGNNSDLYPRWLGTRELLINHRNPYSHEVTREIQAGYYGRPLDPLKPGDPKDQAGFAYPIYVAFFLWPTLQMRFSTLQAVSGWVMLGLSALTVPLWAQGLGLRFSRASQLTATLLLFATYGLQQAYAMRQLTLVVAFLVALSCSAIAGDRLVVAGVTLAIATIKPQLALPLIAVLAIWTLGDLRRRWPMVVSFSLTMLLLVGAGEIVFPHWIGHFLAAAREYQEYAGDKPLLQVFFGRYAGSAIAAVLIILLLFMTWLRRERAFTSVSFSSLVCSAVALDLLIIPKLAPYNDVLLLPAALLLWARRDEMLHGRSLSRVLWRMALVCAGWEWGTAILLAMVSLVKRWHLPMAIAGIPLYTVYAIPTVVFLAIAVLAMRAGHTSEINTSATARS